MGDVTVVAVQPEWSIGDLARKTGLTVKVIRHWSDSGLVHPVRRTAAGYRVYDDGAVIRLELARTLRELGVGLATIRDVLDHEDTLSQVASTHVDVLEVQIRLLRWHQAVLRSVVRRGAADLVAAADLARMSAAERRAVIQEFVTDAVGELDAPAYRQALLAATPELPVDPTGEQIDAWIELGELVRDPASRAALRRFASYAAEHERPGPDAGATVEQTTDEWLTAVREAMTGGLAADSPSADAVVSAVVTIWLPTQGLTADGPEARRLLLEQLEVASDRLMERYWQLVCTINGWPVRPSIAAEGRWLTTALRTNPEPRARESKLADLYDAGDEAWRPDGIIEACERVLTAVGGLVETVERNDFDRPTPCADWDVRALVDHLVWENLLWAGLANGEPRSDFGADHLGDDHVEAFRTAADRTLLAFGRPGMLDQRYGPAPGFRLVEQLLIEMLAHGWDLSRALGRPFTGVDDLAERALPVVREIYDSLPRTEGGSFAHATTVPVDAPALDRLAAYLGRTI
ncbi:TIGR03086 family metal-binding protein [Kribbella sp. CA-247076]|uniref:TIGR03086 family metal-binding protein n=1 Tax=Kribbella sp. CA-247076 TaxID=3239941 RepID=UPI003D907D7B